MVKRLGKKFVIKFLESQAKRLLNRHRPKIIAVAGSVGKTSTKLAIAKVLSQRYQVLAHASSYNSPIGLPLSIFNLRVPQQLFNPFAWSWLMLKLFLKHRRKYPYEVVVLELGADQPGDISYFLRYIKPLMAVITAVTPEHMEGFGSMERVLEEEFELARHCKQVLLNAGDVFLSVKRPELGKESVYTYGVEKGDYRFQIGFHGLEGVRGVLHLGKRAELHVHLQVIGKQSLYGVTAAAAVADLMKLEKEAIKTGVESIRPIPGRMNPLVGLNKSMIIDDSYNSSPDAAIAALDSLYSLPGKRKLAILGSMNELGSYAKEAHQNVGQWCGQLSWLVTVGDQARRYLVPAAKQAGLSKNRIRSFSSPYKAGRFVSSKLRSGDLVLVKGSQNRIFLEEAVKLLLKDPTDQVKLARQTPFWLKLKNQQFGVK